MRKNEKNKWNESYNFLGIYVGKGKFRILNFSAIVFVCYRNKTRNCQNPNVQILSSSNASLYCFLLLFIFVCLSFRCALHFRKKKSDLKFPQLTLILFDFKVLHLFQINNVDNILWNCRFSSNFFFFYKIWLLV